MERGSQKTGKQLCYFTTKAEFEACNDDVIKILLPTGKYRDHDLNFLNCFLNNTPPKEQQFILHWSKSRVPHKAVLHDVFEIATVQLLKDGSERETNYLIPVPVLFEMLGISLTELPRDLLEDEIRSRDLWDNPEDMALDRESAYNNVLLRYCTKNDITFHCIDKRVKKSREYMQQMRI